MSGNSVCVGEPGICLVIIKFYDIDILLTVSCGLPGGGMIC